MTVNLAPTPELQWAVDQSLVPSGRLDVARFMDEFNCLPHQERAAFLAAVDEVQIRSKLWLIDELNRHCKLANTQLVVLGGWYGVLPLLINWRLESPPRQMTCIDIDPQACSVGQRLIGSVYSNISYDCADVMHLDYESLGKNPVTVVINTICEHLPDLSGWWQQLAAGQFVVLQSNNYAACPDHVNAVRDLEHMKQLTPLSQTLFEGVLPLSIMDRFMLIGRR